MRDDLLHYYERELTYLRRTGAEFATRYPKIAARLLLEPNKCDDPHVERILEGFAFLAARVHLKLDDDFPEISEALLEVACPQYVRPIPSMSLVEFHLDPEQGKLTSGLRIPRDTMLYSRPVAGTPCKFRTCYDTTLWPVRVTGAEFVSPHQLRPAVRAPDAGAALRVELRCLPDVTFAELELDRLRFQLNAELNLAATLYELLDNECLRVLVREPGGASKREPLVLPADLLTPVGFGQDEGILPFPRRSLLAYRLLLEYFAFPEKYLFFDLGGFDRVRAAGFGDAVELIFFLAPFERDDRRQGLEAAVTDRTIRLGTTPVVNLFPQTSEPVLLTQKKYEYLVVPDARRRDSTGVYSVDDVVAVSPGSREPLRFRPFHSFRHGSGDGGPRMFWHARRRARAWRPDEGTDVMLSFVDLSGRTVYPDMDAVTVRLTCFNGDLPNRLPFGDEGGDFQMPGGGPIQRIVSLVKPTPAVHPPLGKPQLWRLISQLSLNYMSLVDGGPEALQELLRLHNLSGATSAERQVAGITGLRAGPAYARIDTEHGLAFVRGHRVELELDEEEFVGAGVYLFSSVLERFLGLYVSLNSFNVLAVKTSQRKEILREWPPRAGWKALL